MEDASKPLRGMRVADFSRVLAGPYATQRLADLGADVVKVERPGVGDETRSWGPPFEDGMASYFRSVNRGKRSIAVDLTSPGGREVCRDLCKWADVVVHNFLPDSAMRIGLDPGSIAEVNPSAVVCSISGFGSGRGDGERPGYDLVVQAESGMMAITGEPAGEPKKVGVAIVDVLTGLEAATAILAAVAHAKETGEGTSIEVPLLDSALAAMVNVAQGAVATGAEPLRYGNAHPSIVPYESFTASDGMIVVAAANDGLWRKLCDVLRAPELASDPKFATNPDRVEAREALVPELNRRFSERSASEWVSLLEAEGVPCGRIVGVLEGLSSAERLGERATVRLDDGGEVVGPPARFSGRRSVSRSAPPRLGEDTEAVLAQLGYPRDRVESMLRSGEVA